MSNAGRPRNRISMVSALAALLGAGFHIDFTPRPRGHEKGRRKRQRSARKFWRTNQMPHQGVRECERRRSPRGFAGSGGL